LIRVLITGANGFIGRPLCEAILRHKMTVMAAIRSSVELPEGVKLTTVGEIDSQTNWTDALRNANIVVHLAARVHVMHNVGLDPLVKFRLVNVDGTLNLAHQAAEAGVRRFVYLSSIKVNGEQTLSGLQFTEHDKPAPVDPYAISKWEAEQGLLKISQESGMDIVIIRPPLVYGSDVKANFLTLMHWLHKGRPLPLGAIHNKRSLVALDNLVDLIITCLDHPSAANQVFLAGDGEDISTPELLRRLGLALGRPARLLPVPVSLLKAGAALLGRRDVAQRLCESLQVDISKARNVLGWNPPISVDEGLRQTAQSFLHDKGV